MTANYFHRKAVRWFALAILIVVGSVASKAYGQCPNPNSNNPNEARAGQAIAAAQAQGANVTCTVHSAESMSVYMTFPNGLYVNVWFDGYANHTFMFDPVTGRVTNFYILGDYNDGPSLLIHDSVLGFFNGSDGWFSALYQMGNPFSAAVQNPFAVLMMGFFDPNAAGGSGHPPAPIQGPGGIQ